MANGRSDEDGPSWREFARLEVAIKEGFDSTHRRLDLVNGRVGTSEKEIVRLESDIKNIGREVFRRRNADHQGQGEEWATSAVSKREGALIGLGLVILVTVLKVLEVVGTKFWETLTRHV